jgi:hypothetical protein
VGNVLFCRASRSGQGTASSTRPFSGRWKPRQSVSGANEPRDGRDPGRTLDRDPRPYHILLGVLGVCLAIFSSRYVFLTMATAVIDRPKIEIEKYDSICISNSLSLDSSVWHCRDQFESLTHDGSPVRWSVHMKTDNARRRLLHPAI